LAKRRLSSGRPQRFRQRYAVQILGGVFAAGALWLITPAVLRQLEFFRIRRVEIAGLQYLAPATIISAAGLGERSSVFDDLLAARKELKALPGIRAAQVERRLPGTLEIVIEEAVPVALAPRGAGLALLDSSGNVLPFDPAATAPDLPIAATADRAIAQVLARVRADAPVLFGQIETARRLHGDVVLETDGSRVWLSPSVTAEDIRAVAAVAQDLARRGRRYGELDARFAGQVIVRWRDG
jgi:cell division septal protein FtsQ